MIKDWSNFNEKLYPGDVYDILENNLSTIRDVFTDFEDMNIVAYQISVVNGEDRGNHPNQKMGMEFEIGYTFRPNDDLDKFLHFCCHLIRGGDKACINVDLKFPGEKDKYKLHNSGDIQLDSDGIKLLDDILTANSRLTEQGYDVKLNLNSNHHEYKPMRFKIYFKVI